MTATEHVARLINEFGWSARGVARAAGIERDVIRRLLDGRTIATTAATRLLTIEAAPFVDPRVRREVRICRGCGRNFLALPSSRSRSCSRTCANAGRPHRRFRDGYIDINAPDHPMARADGYVFEHRMVAYDAGLLTRRDQHVHHCNQDKQDNRIENLEVLSAEEHARRHAAEDGWITNQFGTWPLRPPAPTRPGPRPCAMCDTTIPDSARTDKVYCSRRCSSRAFETRRRSAA